MRTFVIPLRLCVVIFFYLLCVCLCMVGNAMAVDVTLAWDPTLSSDLAGYKLYYRTCSAGAECTQIGVVDNLSEVTIPLSELADSGAPRYTLKGLPSESDFVFVVTAYTGSGIQSGFSNEAYYRAPVADPNEGDGSDDLPPAAPSQVQGDDQPPTVPTQLEGIAQSGSGIVLTWAASSDDVGVSTYIVYRDGDQIGTTADTEFTDTNVLAGSTYVYTIVAVDSDGNRSDTSAPLYVTLPSDEGSDEDSGSAVVRVNCGGGTYLDTDGNEWAADSGYNTGRIAFESADIAGTSEDTLFRSNRWDPNYAPEMEYRFDLEDGAYLVRLYFAETWSGAFGSGLRKFHVQLEGQRVESNLDMYAEAGANTAIIRSYKTTVNDGQLNIRFLHSIEDPQINAIEVISQSGGLDMEAPSTPQDLSGKASADGDSVTLSWTAATDGGGSGIDGYIIYRDGVQVGYTSETAFIDAGVEPGCTYTYEISAVDNAYNESAASAAVQVSCGTIVDNRASIRVNVGGGAYTDNQGNRWAADYGYNTGRVAGTTAQIAGTINDTLYQSNRWDPNRSPELEYAFDVADGSYLIILHFAETWMGAFGTGLRIFDIQIEGQLVESNLDMYSEVGANKAFTISQAIVVKDGQINIRFLHAVEDPQVNAIEILPTN
jgi:chitodextrinase